MFQRGAAIRPPTLKESVEEYGRGVAGGMLFSLPMLYTMEVWWTGFLSRPLDLLAYVAMSFVLLLGYNRYAGMRADSTFLEVAIDSVEEMGLGLVISAVVLFLLGRITTDMPAGEAVGKIIVEAMTVAIGVSVGTAQLGSSGEKESSKRSKGGRGDDDDEQPDTGSQLVLAICGAVLFAANVAPTDEILLIGIETPLWKLLGLVALSLLVGALILFQSDFIGTKRHVHHGGAFWITLSLMSNYAAALVASAIMLWFFRRFDGASPIVVVSQTVVLAFPAMLGASAGRLLIQ